MTLLMKQGYTFKKRKVKPLLLIKKMKHISTGNHIKTVCSDHGGEFLSSEFIQHQDARGIIRQLTVHDSPQQNGVAERAMQT